MVQDRDTAGFNAALPDLPTLQKHREELEKLAREKLLWASQLSLYAPFQPATTTVVNTVSNAQKPQQLARSTESTPFFQPLSNLSANITLNNGVVEGTVSTNNDKTYRAKLDVVGLASTIDNTVNETVTRINGGQSVNIPSIEPVVTQAAQKLDGASVGTKINVNESVVQSVDQTINQVTSRINTAQLPIVPIFEPTNPTSIGDLKNSPIITADQSGIHAQVGSLSANIGVNDGVVSANVSTPNRVLTANVDLSSASETVDRSVKQIAERVGINPTSLPSVESTGSGVAAVASTVFNETAGAIYQTIQKPDAVNAGDIKITPIFGNAPVVISDQTGLHVQVATADSNAPTITSDQTGLHVQVGSINANIGVNDGVVSANVSTPNRVLTANMDLGSAAETVDRSVKQIIDRVVINPPSLPSVESTPTITSDQTGLHVQVGSINANIGVNDGVVSANVNTPNRVLTANVDLGSAAETIDRSIKQITDRVGINPPSLPSVETVGAVASTVYNDTKSAVYQTIQPVDATNSGDLKITPIIANAPVITSDHAPIQQTSLPAVILNAQTNDPIQSKIQLTLSTVEPVVIQSAQKVEIASPAAISKVVNDVVPAITSNVNISVASRQQDAPIVITSDSSNQRIQISSTTPSIVASNDRVVGSVAQTLQQFSPIRQSDVLSFSIPLAKASEESLRIASFEPTQPAMKSTAQGQNVSPISQISANIDRLIADAPKFDFLTKPTEAHISSPSTIFDTTHLPAIASAKVINTNSVEASALTPIPASNVLQALVPSARFAQTESATGAGKVEVAASTKALVVSSSETNIVLAKTAIANPLETAVVPGKAVVVSPLEAIVPGKAVVMNSVESVIPGKAVVLNPVALNSIEAVVPGKAVALNPIETTVTGKLTVANSTEGTLTALNTQIKKTNTTTVDGVEIKLPINTVVGRFPGVVGPGAKGEHESTEIEHTSEAFITGDEERYLPGLEIAAILALGAISKVRDHQFNQSEAENALALIERLADLEDGQDNSSRIVTLPGSRREYIISAGETFNGIAQQIFGDEKVGWLIAQLNTHVIKESSIENKVVFEIEARQKLVLPLQAEIEVFSENKKLRPIEDMVTIVTERHIHRETAYLMLEKAMGLTQISKEPAPGTVPVVAKRMTSGLVKQPVTASAVLIASFLIQAILQTSPNIAAIGNQSANATAHK